MPTAGGCGGRTVQRLSGTLDSCAPQATTLLGPVESSTAQGAASQNRRRFFGGGRGTSSSGFAFYWSNRVTRRVTRRRNSCSDSDGTSLGQGRKARGFPA